MLRAVFRFHHLLVVGAGAALMVLAVVTRGRLPWRSPLVIVPALLLVIGALMWSRSRRGR